MGRGKCGKLKNTVGAIGGFINIQLFAINKDKQARHDENNTTGRSILFGGVIAAQEIIDKYAGTGILVGTNREKVKCDRIIGLYKDEYGNSCLSCYAIIVRSKTGDHVYPGAMED